MIDEMKPEVTVVKQPAKRWRSRIKTNFRFMIKTTGETLGPGVVIGKFIWPSAEIAEQKAHEWAERAFDHNNLKSQNLKIEVLDPVEDE